MNETQSPSQSSVSIKPVKRYISDLIQLMTEPKVFFKDRYPELNLVQALTFGIVANWLAAFFEWLTRQVTHQSLLSGLHKIREQLQTLPFWNNLPENFWDQSSTTSNLIPNWLAELTSIAASPFQSLIQFCVSGTMLFIGGYLFIQKKDTEQDALDLSGFIKLTAFASVPHLLASILGFLPLGLNSLIGWIYSVALLMIGISVRYRISNLRSFVIVILPGLLSIFLVGCLVMGIVGLFIAGIVALFGS